MAHDSKILGVLVLSGETNIEILRQSEFMPDIVVDDLAEFGQMLINASGNTL